MGRRLVTRDGERGNGLAGIKTGRGQGITDKKVIKCILLSAFLIAITILPSYEAIDLRYRKSVDISENPASYQLQEGDAIEQKLILDKNDRIDDLRVWLSADTAKQNRGTLQIILMQDAVVAESRIDTSQIVGEEYVPAHLKLARFTDGELLLRITVEDLDNDASVSIRRTSGGAIYGLPEATINGKPCGGTLSLNFKIRQPRDIEFLVSLGMVLLLIVVSILSSYVMTYTEETPRTGWLLVALYVILAMSVYSLQYPSKTWEGESFAEGAVFFYNNATTMNVLDAICQLEGGMYLSSVQNLIMIIAVKVLHLKTYVHVAIQSMATFFWIMCLALFCSHYFSKYFPRMVRFAFSLIVTCYGFVLLDYVQVGYCGAFFLLLLLIYDFDKAHNFIYGLIFVMIPVICTSKMMYVVFVPVTLLYYALFRNEMNRKKKCCVAMIGFFSFLEGLLSIILKKGVQSGHSLGTIQHVAIPTLLNKIAYYLVQTFGIQLRCGVSNANQLFVNVCTSIIVVGMFGFTVWQVVRKGNFKREAKFILVMFSLVMSQCAVIVLTTPEWHAGVDWRKSLGAFPGHPSHFINLYFVSGIILLLFLEITIKYMKPYFKKLIKLMNPTEHIASQAIALCLVVGMTFFYINQHPGPKNYDAANPLRSNMADWKAYVTMLNADAFCIRVAPNTWYYRKNALEKSVAIPRSASVDLSGVAELNGKSSIVLYAHKTAVTNQILDRYYYANLYDRDGKLISRLRQLNSDPERLYIAFYPGTGIANIGHVEFTYEDGSQAFVDETIEIGYR